MGQEHKGRNCSSKGGGGGGGSLSLGQKEGKMGEDSCRFV